MHDTKGPVWVKVVSTDAEADIEARHDVCKLELGAKFVLIQMEYYWIVSIQDACCRDKSACVLR